MSTAVSQNKCWNSADCVDQRKNVTAVTQFSEDGHQLNVVASEIEPQYPQWHTLSLSPSLSLTVRVPKLSTFW